MNTTPGSDDPEIGRPVTGNRRERDLGEYGQSAAIHALRLEVRR